MTAAPDLTGYRLAHRSLRAGARRLAEGAATLDPLDRRQVQAFTTYWEGFAGVLHHHHVAEDDIVFPALVDRVAAAGAVLDSIDGEHESMVRLTTAIGDELARVGRGRGPSRLQGLLEDLADLLHRHLDVEDADLLPMVERNFTGLEWAAIEERLHSGQNFLQVRFLVSFVASHATPDEHARMVAEAPAPMRLMVRLGRRSYERTCAEAFPRTPFRLPADAAAALAA